MFFLKLGPPKICCFKASFCSDVRGWTEYQLNQMSNSGEKWDIYCCDNSKNKTFYYEYKIFYETVGMGSKKSCNIVQPR